MILVTGATGHIGNVLVTQLAANYPGETLRLFLQKNEKMNMFDGMTLEIYFGDIRKPADVQRAVKGARLVFHLAGLIDTAPRQPQLLHQVNIGGTRLIVEACLEHKVERLVYVSSVHALPDLPKDQVITEIKAFPVPGLLGAYALTKTEATAVVYDGIRRGLDAVVVFPSGIIGPYDFQQSQMGRLLRYLSTQGRLRLVMSFNGAYNFADVRDVASGMIAAAQKGRCGEGYILSGHQVSLRDVIFLEREAMGQRRPVVFFAPNWIVRTGAWIVNIFSRTFGIKPIFTPESVSILESNSNISHVKATTELGYQPRPLLDTFRDSILWMQENGQIRKPKQQKPVTRKSSV